MDFSGDGRKSLTAGGRHLEAWEQGKSVNGGEIFVGMEKESEVKRAE